MKILVIAAHPDDEVLGCGGVIQKHRKNKDSVSVCILTEGASGRYRKKMLKVLKEYASDCARELGVSKLFFKDLPNQMLDTLPITKVIECIEGVIKIEKPDIVYTHDKGDLNRDHRIVYEATMVAARPLPGNKIKALFTYFVPSSSEYGYLDEQDLFIPNVFIDIKDEIDKKIEAFCCYKSEIRPYPHPRSKNALKIYAQRWGTNVSLEYAEPFRLIRQVHK